MKKLSVDINNFISGIDADVSLIKKAYRAAQVRQMWAECVDKVILEHTNSVYIITEDDFKTLIVYVDESIYAAELNARRELIKLKLLQEFEEDIQDFKILISRGHYKKNYPFRQKVLYEQAKSIKEIPLSDEEKTKVEEIVACVEDKDLRAKLKKAIIVDWESKKGLEEE